MPIVLCPICGGWDTPFWKGFRPRIIQWLRRPGGIVRVFASEAEDTRCRSCWTAGRSAGLR